MTEPAAFITARERAAVLLAFAEGKQVEACHKSPNSHWGELGNPPKWNFEEYNYRIAEPPAVARVPREWRLTRDVDQTYIHRPDSQAELVYGEVAHVIEKLPGWKLVPDAVREVLPVGEVELPDGVPLVPEGFVYFGAEPLVYFESGSSCNDVAALNERGIWVIGSRQDDGHKALRIGSEVWKRNMKPAPEPGEGDVVKERHFMRADGYRWTVDKLGAIRWHWNSKSGACAFGIEALLSDPKIYETTAEGLPIEGRMG